MAAFAYHEPYKVSSVLLTLVMHAIFFSVLYLGVNWQAQQQEGMEVELWGELPQPAVPAAPAAHAAETPPAKPVPAKPAEQPAPPPKADISLAEKKKEASKPKQAAKPEPKRKQTKEELKRREDDLRAAEQAADAAASEQQAANKEKAALMAKASAALKTEVGKYKTLISSKIRSKIVMPPDVPEKVLAIFDVTLLPDGSVLEKKLIKSSGNAAYDAEVERAILKAQPLPLPKDDAAREQFINPIHLQFKFSPQDGE